MSERDAEDGEKSVRTLQDYAISSSEKQHHIHQNMGFLVFIFFSALFDSFSHQSVKLKEFSNVTENLWLFCFSPQGSLMFLLSSVFVQQVPCGACHGHFSIPHNHPSAPDREAEPAGHQHLPLNWTLGFLTGRPQSVRIGNSTSSTTTLSTGAPQGCVLSPLLFTLLNHDCAATHSSNHILKFTDDTTVMGLISKNKPVSVQRGGAEANSLVERQQ
ncbi:hypothetical protein QTP86_010787, partial [Hemibagrus guttatus]